MLIYDIISNKLFTNENNILYQIELDGSKIESPRAFLPKKEISLSDIDYIKSTLERKNRDLGYYNKFLKRLMFKPSCNRKTIEKYRVLCNGLKEDITRYEFYLKYIFREHPELLI